MSEPKKWSIVFDIELMKPGCVLLQATMANVPPNFSELFASGLWLVHPTPGMKVYAVTESELERLARKVECHHRSRV
jgi:hypothetical protein